MFNAGEEARRNYRISWITQDGLDFRIEGAWTPGAKQQAVKKMDELLTVPPMEPSEQLFFAF